MKVIAIIPARMASSRFPGKPLAEILGIPMIGHVYLRSKMSEALDEVYVATCDREIFDYIKSIGGNVVMTAATHQRASDRAAEAVLAIEHNTGQRVDIVTMIQGDEPMLYPEMIEKAVEPIVRDSAIEIVNLMAQLKSKEEQNDPNEIKVVVDLEGFAIYFSRAPIPSLIKSTAKVPLYKQVCVIPFRRDFLIKFNELTPTPLEISESVDMLRVIEHGYKVRMVLTDFDTYSVDTPGDLKRVEKLMQNDALMQRYNRRIDH